MKRNTFTWISLVIFSSASAFLGDFQKLNENFLMLVLLLLSVKGQLIVDQFMELGKVKGAWRWILSAFCPVISLVIYTSWQMGQST